MEAALRIAVPAAWAWALVALLAQGIRARGYGRLEHFAAPAGNPLAGVLYAFGPGMSPAAKESTREHLPAYFTGVGYHLGIFASLAWLALLLAGFQPGGVLLRSFQVLMLAGALCGAGLLVKRLVVPTLRGLSCPDDVLANLLTTALAGLAFATTVQPAAAPWLLGEAVILLVYLPLGKIRHCFFFFTTRYHMGSYYGRRGTFPPGA